MESGGDEILGRIYTRTGFAGHNTQAEHVPPVESEENEELYLKNDYSSSPKKQLSSTTKGTTIGEAVQSV